VLADEDPRALQGCRHLGANRTHPDNVAGMQSSSCKQPAAPLDLQQLQAAGVGADDGFLSWNSARIWKALTQRHGQLHGFPRQVHPIQWQHHSSSMIGFLFD
jgi:hypothetical protein